MRKERLIQNIAVMGVGIGVTAVLLLSRGSGGSVNYMTSCVPLVKGEHNLRTGQVVQGDIWPHSSQIWGGFEGRNSHKPEKAIIITNSSEEMVPFVVRDGGACLLEQADIPSLVDNNFRHGCDGRCDEVIVITYRDGGVEAVFEER